MANSLITTLRHSHLFANNLRIFNTNALAVYISSQKTRQLYSQATLGIDGFVLQKQRTQSQMVNIGDKFREKMNEYSKEDSKNMIFTEDLKNMVHLSESDSDVELVVKMIKRFNQQNKQLRFGNYVFGPVVMRLLYVKNKVDLALECFKSEEMTGFFDQLMTYQILMDLLYENKKYKDVLDVLNIIKERQIEGLKYPRNIVVLALAACYKINTKESLQEGLKIWKDLQDIGHFPMRRATTFLAGLAINQGEPAVAMEVLTLARNQNYTTVRNLKAAALADIGRVEDVIPILKSIISEDIPESKVQHTFNRDVLDKVKNAILKLDNPDVSLEFNRLEQLFEKQGHISNSTLDEQLCMEIQKPPVLNNRQGRFERYQRNDMNTNRNKYRTYKERPGLAELV